MRPRAIVPPEEFERRRRNAQKVATFFRAHEGEDVTIPTLEKLAGRGGWRTRVSDARIYVFEPEGGALINTIKYVEGEDGPIPVSTYRYSSNPLGGRDASAYVPGNMETGTLFNLQHEPSGWQESR